MLVLFLLQYWNHKECELTYSTSYFILDKYSVFVNTYQQQAIIINFVLIEYVLQMITLPGF